MDMAFHQMVNVRGHTSLDVRSHAGQGIRKRLKAAGSDYKHIAFVFVK